MRLFLILLSLVSLVGCSLFGGKKVTSEWKALDKTVPVSCEDWPEQDKDLAVERLHVLGREAKGFLAEARERKGARAFYYAPFSDSIDIDDDDLAARMLGPKAVVVGGGSYRKRLYLGVVQPEPHASRFELRGAQDNVVRYQAKSLPRHIRQGEVSLTRKGAWLSFHAAGSERAIEGTPTEVVFAKFPRRGSALLVRTSKRFRFPHLTQLLADEGRARALAVWFDGKKKVFKVQSLNGEKARVGSVQPLDLPITDEVESWHAVLHRSGVLLAYVDGDSLVGNAKLRFAYFRWGELAVNKRWVSEKSLSGIHISEPVWISTGKRAYLLATQWIDKEATIGAYEVSTKSVRKSAKWGVFPSSMRLLSLFEGEDDEDFYGLIRKKKRYGWRFEICKFNAS